MLTRRQRRTVYKSPVTIAMVYIFIAKQRLYISLLSSLCKAETHLHADPKPAQPQGSGAGAVSRLKSPVVFNGVDAENMSNHYHLCSPVFLSYQLGLSLSLELVSCGGFSLSYQGSSLSVAESSDIELGPQTSRLHHILIREDTSRQVRRRLVIVILFQACGSSRSVTRPSVHLGADSATCRTAASNARSARVSMALRSHRVP